MALVNLILAVVNISLAVFTVITNVGLLTIIATKRSLRTRTNIILANLCFSDLLVAVVTQGMFTADLLRQSPDLCPILKSTGRIMCIVSFLTVAVAAGDRYCAIFYPYRYQSWLSRNTTLVVEIIVIWLFPLILILSLSWTNTSEYILQILLCTIGLIGMVTMMVIHVRIFFVIHRIQREVNDLHTRFQCNASRRQIKRRAKGTRFTAAAMTLNFICYTPLIFFAVMVVHSLNAVTVSIYFGSLTLSFLPSAIHPLLFLLLNKDARYVIGKSK